MRRRVLTGRQAEYERTKEERESERWNRERKDGKGEINR